MKRSKKTALTSCLRKTKAATLGLAAMVVLGATLAAEAWLLPGDDREDAAMAGIQAEGIRAGWL